MTYGILQGSPRGLLFCTVYVNDIGTNLRNVKLLDYAYKIKLYLEIKREDRFYGL